MCEIISDTILFFIQLIGEVLYSLIVVALVVLIISAFKLFFREIKAKSDENEIRQKQSSIKPVKEKTDSIPVKLDMKIYSNLITKLYGDLYICLWDKKGNITRPGKPGRKLEFVWVKLSTDLSTGSWRPECAFVQYSPHRNLQWVLSL